MHCECEKLKSIRNKSSQMEATMMKRLADIKGVVVVVIIVVVIVVIIIVTISY